MPLALSPRTAAPAAPATAALELVAISRAFGSTLALAPLTLRQAPGTICLLSGPNGSGKSTLLRLAAGALAPTSGTRRTAGRALYLRPGDGARRAQTVRQAVEFVAALRRGGPGRAGADEVLAATGLLLLADRLVGTLSAGQRGRVTIAVALAAAPAVACLDEPTAHLDGPGVAAAAEAVLRLRDAGACVLVATHDAFLAEAADARLHLCDGRVVAA